MHIETLREYCISKPHVNEKFPFDETTLVFYVAEKMFALVPLDDLETKVNLKCDPERSAELREKYPQIKPGFHMSKLHWNTVNLEGLSDDFIRELIDHSYEMVIRGFSRKKRIELGFEKNIK